MTADDDKVDGPASSGLHDLGCRLADMNELKRRRLRRSASTECSKEFSAILFTQDDEFACRNPTLLGLGNNRRVDRMNKRHFSPE